MVLGVCDPFVLTLIFFTAVRKVSADIGNKPDVPDLPVLYRWL